MNSLFSVFKPTSSVIALFIILSSTSSIANESSSEIEQVERITVVGQRSLSSLIRDYERAKFEMYDVYNKINQVEKFSVKCRVVKPIGTQIAKKECLPQYFREMSADVTSLALLTGSGNVGFDPSLIRMKTRQLEREFYEHIANKAQEHPKLLSHLRNIKDKFEKILEVKIQQDPALLDKLKSEKEKLSRNCSLTSACFRTADADPNLVDANS